MAISLDTNAPQPDARIARYIAALNESPRYVNDTWCMLPDMYSAHGRGVIDALLTDYFKALRAYENSVRAASMKAEV